MTDCVIPELLAATVVGLQAHIQGEEAVYDDIAQTAVSPKATHQVQEGIATLTQLLSVVSGGVQHNAATLSPLKAEMTQELHHAEMACHTLSASPASQLENSAQNEYFAQLVGQLEGHMASYRTEIESLEKHVASLQQGAPGSSPDTFTVIRNVHQSFIALAARLQNVHQAVQSQREQFVNCGLLTADTQDVPQTQS